MGRRNISTRWKSPELSNYMKYSLPGWAYRLPRKLNLIVERQTGGLRLEQAQISQDQPVQVNLMNRQLNPYQKRSLEVVLRTFEERLRQTRTWLQSPEENGILYRKTGNVSLEQKEMIESQIDLALEQIAWLASTFDLKLVEEDIASWLRGVMSESWADLIDTQANKLQRFGEVSSELHEMLDPIVSRLAQLALEIANANEE
jgi:hypothetical protein